MQQHTFNINIYTEFNLKDVILAIKLVHNIVKS